MLGSAWGIRTLVLLSRDPYRCVGPLQSVMLQRARKCQQDIRKEFLLIPRGGEHASVWLFGWKHGHKSHVPSLFLLHTPGEVWWLVILMFLISFFQQMDQSINVDCVNNEGWLNCNCDGGWSSGEPEFRKQLPRTSWTSWDVGYSSGLIPLIVIRLEDSPP